MVLIHESHYTHEALNAAYILSAGFMQFVQSVPVAEVLATEGNIQVILNRTFNQVLFCI